jgi:peptidoglycan/xylan/chitin deacetylase (PgdA/CDA1 family)
MAKMRSVDRLKYLLKCSAAYALYGVGLLHLWKRIALRSKAVVLTYHRVLSDDARARSWSHPAIIVSPETFERQMRLLSRWFTVLRLSEFESHLKSRSPFKTASCLVTFDDGWRETYTEAWPVLRRLRMPATVFLPVTYIGSDDVFWQEHLGRLLCQVWQFARQGPDERRVATELLSGSGFEGVLDLQSDAVKETIIDLVRAKKSDTGWTPGAALDRLEKLSQNDAASEIDRFLTWDQVLEMSADDISFGAHGETHRMLTSLPRTEVDRELRVARQKLTEKLRNEISAVSYPNGSWSPAVAAAAAEAGFTSGFSMRRGPVSVDDDQFVLRRVNIFDDVTSNTPMFLARLLGVF